MIYYESIYKYLFVTYLINANFAVAGPGSSSYQHHTCIILPGHPYTGFI